MARGNRGGRRVAPRRAAPRARRPWGRLLALGVGITLTIVAWGYLVTAAIDFGTAARAGDDQAWLFLGTATLGAVACLFVALLLAARTVRLLRQGGPAPARRRERPPGVTRRRGPGAPDPRSASRSRGR